MVNDCDGKGGCLLRHSWSLQAVELKVAVTMPQFITVDCELKGYVNEATFGHWELREKEPVCCWDHIGSLWMVGKGFLVFLGS